MSNEIRYWGAGRWILDDVLHRQEPMRHVWETCPTVLLKKTLKLGNIIAILLPGQTGLV